MRIEFYLKGSIRLVWNVPHPDNFNFQIMVKMIRADGQFLVDSVYIQASEIAAIRAIEDDESSEAVVHHSSKVSRLVS